MYFGPVRGPRFWINLVFGPVRSGLTKNPKITVCRTGPKTDPDWTDLDQTVPFWFGPRSGILDQIGLGPIIPPMMMSRSAGWPGAVLRGGEMGGRAGSGGCRTIGRSGNHGDGKIDGQGGHGSESFLRTSILTRGLSLGRSLRFWLDRGS
nr:hypothetical protein [Tanacetum cinerariifolium]